MSNWPGAELKSTPAGGGVILEDPNAGLERTRTETGIQDTNIDNARASTNDAFSNTSGLRKEFEDKSSVKAYKISIPAYTAALSTEPTPQGDISLIYSYAKLMDPESVVRESEADMVTNSDTVSGRWYQKLSKELTGDGTFRPEVRARLRGELQNRIKYWNEAYNTERQSYEELAKQYNFDPKLITGEHFGRRFKPDIQKYWEKQAPKDVEQSGGVPLGTNVSFAGDDGGFDRNKWLVETTGFDPNGEANLVAWMSANSGNPAITKEDVQDAYRRFSNGRSSGAVDDAFMEQFRSQKTPWQGFDSTQAEGEFKAKVDALAKERDTVAGGIDAVVRGAADTLSVGLADKAAALANTVTEGGTYAENLDAERIANAADEQVNPLYRAGGQIAGALAVPIGVGARTPMELAKAGGTYGGLYEFNQADGLNAETATKTLTGAVTGAGGGYVGGRVIDAVSPVVSKVSPFVERVFGKTIDRGETSAQKYARGQDFGVDMSIGDAGGMGPKITERILDAQPGSGTIMNEGRNATKGQFQNAVENVSDTYGAPTSFVGVGEAAQAGARKWMAKLDTVVGKAYDAVPISAKAKAELTNTRAALDGLVNKFESNPDLNKMSVSPKMRQYQEALKGDLSWQDLKGLRTQIGEDVGEQLFTDGARKSELRGLYSALTSDMEATALQQGPAALAKFRRANDLYKAGQDRIEGAITKLVGNDGNLNPEKAAATIQRIAKSGKGSSDIRLLAEVRKSIPKEEWGQIANGMIRQLGRPAGSEGRDFAVDTFARNYKDMSAEAKNLMFGKSELRANLDEFFKLSEDLAASNATRNTSNTAMGVAGGLGYIVGGIPAMLGQAVVSGATAKLWTNPKFVKWMTGYGKMLKAAEKTGSVKSQDTQMELLNKIAAREPAIAADIFSLQERLAQTFAGPERLAATEEEQKKLPIPPSSTTGAAPQ